MRASARTALILASICLLAAIVAISGPVAAQTGPGAASVEPGDAAADQRITPINCVVGFLDGDADYQIDATSPDEPVYLDTNHDGVVSFGDVRLTAFGSYARWSTVDLPNVDYGHKLTTTTGWFAREATGAWYFDSDASLTITAGDVRVTGPGGKVAQSDARGAALTPVQQNVAQTNRIAIKDLNADGAYQPGETLYVDTDRNTGAGGTVSADDLRITPGPLATDKATAAPPPPPPPGSSGTGSDTTTTIDGRTYVQQTASTGWRTLDWILVGLAVANLAAFIFVVRTVKPRNPFR
jgi:hypothetical protein